MVTVEIRRQFTAAVAGKIHSFRSIFQSLIIFLTNFVIPSPKCAVNSEFTRLFGWLEYGLAECKFSGTTVEKFNSDDNTGRIWAGEFTNFYRRISWKSNIFVGCGTIRTKIPNFVSQCSDVCAYLSIFFFKKMNPKK